jgi:IS30 family transposase
MHLRGARKRRRKRYGRYDSRGRLAGERLITTRPAAAETCAQVGHWEADTTLGAGQAGPCVLSMVERRTGYLALGKLRQRTSPEVNQRAAQLIDGQPHPVRTMLGDSQAGPCVLSLVERKTGDVMLGQLGRRTSAQVNRRARRLIRQQPHPVPTITVDNGTEFHEYAALERATAARFYFATPHHAWERGTNENTNGLLRQYLPKGHSMAHLTQHDCNRIATKLNRRPRKRLGSSHPRRSVMSLWAARLQRRSPRNAFDPRNVS